MWNCEMSSGGGSGGVGVGFQLPDVHPVQIIHQQQQHHQQQQQQHLNRWGGELELTASPYFFVDAAMLGSDLELASPGGFDSCIMDSSWTSSNKEQHCSAPAPAQGLETIPSPTSSEVSIRNLSHHNTQQQSIAPRQIQHHQHHLQHQQQQSQQFVQHQEQYHHHQHHEQYHHQDQQQHQLLQATNASEHHVDVSSSSSVSSFLNRASISGNSSKTSNDGQSHRQHHHRHGHNHHHLQEQHQQHQQQQQRSNCGDESVGSPSGGSIGFNRENGGGNGGVAGGNLVDGGGAVVAADLGNDLLDVSNKGTSATSSAAALRGPSERMMDISLEDLSRYFTMPITQASKELKVGLTVLKKRCREFGIPRWPHRKLKSLESLIYKSQELAKDSDGNAPNPVIHAVHELEKQKKKMEQSPGIELDDRTKRFRQAIFKASYKQRRRAVAPSNGSNGGGNSDSSQASHNNGSAGQEQDLQQQ